MNLKQLREAVSALAQVASEQEGRLNALEAALTAILRPAAEGQPFDERLHAELERAYAALLGESTNPAVLPSFEATRARVEAARRSPPAD